MVAMDGSLTEGNIYDLEDAVYDMLRALESAPVISADSARGWVRRICEAVGLNYEGIRGQVHEAAGGDSTASDVLYSDEEETDSETESDSDA